ncbi:MAG TPA: pantoate--beta-alanine ligase [Hyphomonadaceae bacterium]|nr:pantoate--beta-alanine ligase [Hyphomonadaceae bacterium]
MPKRSGLVVARTRAEARDWHRAQRAAGKRIAFAPTMGALHDGHISLIKLGLEKADVAASSIFVNPTQFAAHEDLGTYPRAEASDLEKLEAAGCSFCYCPSPSEMYPPGDSTRVIVKDLSHILEGEVRPHFFEGVASVVSRLFLHIQPDVAVFGEKDYQQLLVIKRMTNDLGFPIEIIGAPTRREADGLAMSSRNAYLDAQQRSQAAAMARVMKETAAKLEAGEPIRAATDAAKADLIAAGFASVDYVEARRADTLAPFGAETCPNGATGRLLFAARLGKTRLIDNMGFVRR